MLDDAAVLRLDVHLDVLCNQLQAVDAQGGADPLPEVWAVQDEQNHEQGEADQVRNVEQLKNCQTTNSNLPHNRTCTFYSRS